MRGCLGPFHPRDRSGLSTPRVVPTGQAPEPWQITALSLECGPVLRTSRQLEASAGEGPQKLQPVLSSQSSAGRKMRVYQREEGPCSSEAQPVFLEPGQASQQAQSTEEPRPLELSGATRVGLEGSERRRFSASELMTRLHSSLRLGRSSAARALAASSTGAIREGTRPSPGPIASQTPVEGKDSDPHWVLVSWRVATSGTSGTTFSALPPQGKHLEGSHAALTSGWIVQQCLSPLIRAGATVAGPSQGTIKPTKARGRRVTNEGP